MRSFPFVAGLLSLGLSAAAWGQDIAGPSGLALQLDPELREAPREPPGALFIRGDAIRGRSERDVTLQGEAEIRRDGLVIRADRITFYDIDQEVIGVGNVRVIRDGQAFTGEQVQLRLDSNTGTIESTQFSLADPGGQGSAARVNFLGRDRIGLTDAVYSTCRPDRPDWYLRAETLEIDQSAGDAIGKRASVVFMGLPILSLPSFTFTLGDDRRSGFLTPYASVSSRAGAEFGVPYYWNIAPNRDLTLTPSVLTRRGLQLAGNYRYLEPAHTGELTAEYLSQDAISGRNRWLLDSRQRFAWSSWSAGWSLLGVSDDNYFVDFSRNIVTSAQRSLPRDAFIGRHFGDWHFQARMLQYQNLLDARLAPPFDRLPQLSLSTVRRNVAGFDLSLMSDASWFRRDLAGSAEGARLVVNPSVAYPINGPGWFVQPRLSMHATAYRLEVNPFGPSSIDRVVPTASIDSGLVMERPVELRGRSLVQTLEPRLFYVYTPYQEQDRLPVFDSATTVLSYATLFSDRTFSGQDRIANANQLTPGLVSRLIDPQTGIEALRLGVAQRWYFDTQRVTIPGVPTRTDTRSDLLMGASAEFGNGHGLDAGAQFSLRDARTPQFDIAWRWWPSEVRVVNVAARYRQYDFAQLDTSWRHPVAARWAALGRLNYSVLREQLDAAGQVRSVSPQLLEAVAGFEYSADCWTLRFVMQNFVAAPGQRNSAFFVQLELGGLARVGLNPLDILVRNIPGYRVLDHRQSPSSRYLGYE